jgi:hypothetical protein
MNSQKKLILLANLLNISYYHSHLLQIYYLFNQSILVNLCKVLTNISYFHHIVINIDYNFCHNKLDLRINNYLVLLIVSVCIFQNINKILTHKCSINLTDDNIYNLCLPRCNYLKLKHFLKLLSKVDKFFNIFFMKSM